MDALTLAREAVDAMFAHARETHPDECCGAVVTRAGRDEAVRFTNIQNRLHADNPDENPRDARMGYAPEPKELLAVLRTADEPGTTLTAFYHSHAVNGSYFSGEDRARAMFGDDPAYPDVTYLVVSDARTPSEIRGFRWDDEAHDFVEQALVIQEAAPAPAARRSPAPVAPPVTAKKAAPKPVATKKPATTTKAAASKKATVPKKAAATKKVSAAKKAAAAKTSAVEKRAVARKAASRRTATTKRAPAPKTKRPAARARAARKKQK